MKKILVLRFSSLGDIAQAAPIAAALKQHDAKSQVHWVTRSDFAEFAGLIANVDQIWTLDKKTGWSGLISLFKKLQNENFTHIYDAHNNLRSNILLILWRLVFIFRAPKILKRSKNRWRRFLFFKFRAPVLPQPFIGARSFIEPLSAWGLSQKIPNPPHLKPNTKFHHPDLKTNYIVFAPSAAWPTKRWPIEHWKSLALQLSEQQIVLIGGKEDTFCEDIRSVAPERILNLSGKTSLFESCLIVHQTQLLISADTGFLHIADQMGVKNIGLIGPTAFGYTSQPQSQILEVFLDCKPCSKDGRDRCTNAIEQKCMKDILPARVTQTALQTLKTLVAR